MLKNSGRILLSLICGIAATLFVHSMMRADHGVISKATDIKMLVEQAKGEAIYWNAHDRPRGNFDHWKYRHYKSSCAQAAIKRLAELGPEAKEAVPSLIEILHNGQNDYDTGDGILPVRSSVAITLGMIGDSRSIPHLIEKLKVSEPYAMSSYRENFTKGWPRRSGAGHEAIASALAMFGADASKALPILKSINEDKNSMAANSPGVLKAIEAIANDKPPELEYLELIYLAYGAW